LCDQWTRATAKSTFHLSRILQILESNSKQY